MATLHQINNSTTGETGGTARAKLNDWLAQILTSIANIATNTTNIATNTSAIAANTTSIATNTAAISTNTTNIATNATNINNLTTTVAGKQDLGGVSTLHSQVQPTTSDYVIPNTNQDIFLFVRNTIGTFVTVSLDATIPNYAIGKTFEIYNDSTSSATVKLDPVNGVTINYIGNLTDTLAIGVYAKIIHYDTNTWLRVQ